MTYDESVVLKILAQQSEIIQHFLSGMSVAKLADEYEVSSCVVEEVIRYQMNNGQVIQEEEY